MGKYIDPLIKEGKLIMEKPDRPKSKNQRYYSTGIIKATVKK